MKEFNRTPPLDFYPRSPCGERRKLPESNTSVSNFYPRSPCGERLVSSPAIPIPSLFLSTLSLRRATVVIENISTAYAISIHALLAESDFSKHVNISYAEAFLSTLSLRRATAIGGINGVIHTVFLSTLSLRRATPQPGLHRAAYGYFYPRSPCGERHLCGIPVAPYTANFYPRSPCGERRFDTLEAYTLTTMISIHALLAESDRRGLAPDGKAGLFLSTLSLRRATRRPGQTAKANKDFYPRSPCGERQPDARHANSQQEFLSTLSLRRATRYTVDFHAKTGNFYPRSPCGERQRTWLSAL